MKNPEQTIRKILIISMIAQFILLGIGWNAGYLNPTPTPAPSNNCWDNYKTEQEAIQNCETHDPIQALIKQQQLQNILNTLISKANQTPYVFQGATPSGWDCSGLVVWTYQQLGINIPHSANAQGHLGDRVSKPQPGDIVVFANTGSTSFDHSAIYLGNNKIINANRLYGTTKIQSLKDFGSKQIRFIRLEI
jgi:cell wall-associated NlpC family hydrolase